MRRREFITLMGVAAAAWPLGSRAQQQALPVVGVLNGRGANEAPELLAAFRQGLNESGFVEGQNIAIEYRFANHQNERLAALANELVDRRVTVIAATNTAAAVAAKAATTRIPVVFAIAGNPVQLGLVSSLNRPGGNVTGVTQLALDVIPKRLELLLPRPWRFSSTNPIPFSPSRKSMTCKLRPRSSGWSYMSRMRAASGTSMASLQSCRSCVWAAL
jgi:putative ABC transport system substrate-binding protein